MWKEKNRDGGFRREEVMTREILRLRREDQGVELATKWRSRIPRKKVTGTENEAEKLSAGIINGND